MILYEVSKKRIAGIGLGVLTTAGMGYLGYKSYKLGDSDFNIAKATSSDPKSFSYEPSIIKKLRVGGEHLGRIYLSKLTGNDKINLGYKMNRGIDSDMINKARKIMHHDLYPDKSKIDPSFEHPSKFR